MPSTNYMIFKEYLPPNMENYISSCHLKPIDKTRRDEYVCSKCREILATTIFYLTDKTPTKASILHLFNEMPTILQH